MCLLILQGLLHLLHHVESSKPIVAHHGMTSVVHSLGPKLLNNFPGSIKTIVYLHNPIPFLGSLDLYLNVFSVCNFIPTSQLHHTRNQEQFLNRFGQLNISWDSSKLCSNSECWAFGFLSFGPSEIFNIPSKQAAHRVMTLAFMAGSNFKLKNFPYWDL